MCFGLSFDLEFPEGTLIFHQEYHFQHLVGTVLFGTILCFGNRNVMGYPCGEL